MKSNTYIYLITWFLLSLLGQTLVHAQQGKGSTTLDNSLKTIDEGTTELIFSESLYLGPDAVWEINGDLEIFAKQIWIAPTAKLTGSGRITINNPGNNPFYESWPDQPTYIDGNDGAYITVNVILKNAHNLILKDIDNPGYTGLTLPVGNKSAALKIGKSFEFRVDGADVLLNGQDMELDVGGTLLNANVKRMIVTGNDTNSHLIKHLVGTAQWDFPVGIKEGDYSPATLSIAQTAILHVGVVDYTASALEIQDPKIGMDRVWHIYADRSLKAGYTLQHNAITNGSAYVDATAQVVQNAGNGNWIGDVTSFSSTNTVSIHTRKDLETYAQPTLSGTWFTKFSKKIIGPTAVDDAATLAYGSSVVVSVLKNDLLGSAPIITQSVRATTSPKFGTIVLNSDGSFTYIPHDNLYIGLDEFLYEITDENGFKSIARVVINILPRELVIPNVITPNGDKHNETWVITGREGYDRIEVAIFNRWGNEVYRNSSYDDSWSGAGLNEGTYYYMLTAYRGSQTRQMKGWILIKRN